MKDFLKLSLAIAFAWVLASIPIWLFFSIYFNDVTMEIRNLREEVNLAWNESKQMRIETATYNENSKQLREDFLKEVSDLYKRTDKLPSMMRSYFDGNFVQFYNHLDGLSNWIYRLAQRLPPAKEPESFPEDYK